MQYLDHDLEVSPPEIQEEKEEYIRTLFETVNLSFDSAFGGFDVDFYYKENASWYFSCSFNSHKIPLIMIGG